MNLHLFRIIDPKILIIKGTVKIKQNVATKHTLIGSVLFNHVDVMASMLVNCWHLSNPLKLDFTLTSPFKYIRNAIIDQDKRLIIHGDSKAGNTLHFNTLMSA
jgi:hypothetical protein